MLIIDKLQNFDTSLHCFSLFLAFPSLNFLVNVIRVYLSITHSWKISHLHIVHNSFKKNTEDKKEKKEIITKKIFELTVNFSF